MRAYIKKQNTLPFSTLKEAGMSSLYLWEIVFIVALLFVIQLQRQCCREHSCLLQWRLRFLITSPPHTQQGTQPPTHNTHKRTHAHTRAPPLHTHTTRHPPPYTQHTQTYARTHTNTVTPHTYTHPKHTHTHTHTHTQTHAHTHAHTPLSQGTNHAAHPGLQPPSQPW